MKSAAVSTPATEVTAQTTPQQLPLVTQNVEQRAPLARFRQISGLDIRDSVQQICDKESLEGRERPSEKVKCDIHDTRDAQTRVKSHSESDGNGRHESAAKIGVSRTASHETSIREDQSRASKLRMRRHSEQKLGEYKSAEDKCRVEYHDLYSSASDEGILSKELSSEEYLPDKTDGDLAKGLESEG